MSKCSDSLSLFSHLKTELLRTKTEYDNSLSMKIFLFQFVNSYSACFYIAFIKGKVVGYPGQPVYVLGKFRNEEVQFAILSVRLFVLS